MRCAFAAVVAVFVVSLSLPVFADDTVRSGQEVFETSCEGCHTGGFAGFFGGAPELGDKDDWQALIPKGVDGLTEATIAGVGSMSPRGGCNDCLDEEIRAAVRYMLESVR